jgi:hypothetical protein
MNRWKYYAKSGALFVAFGFASTAAGASFSEHPVAFTITLLLVITIGLHEFNEGLKLGSEVANKIWRERFHDSIDRVLKRL